jgi:hypothetical protein
VPECLGLFDRFPDAQVPSLDHSCSVGGIAVAPDGSLYLAETNVHRITRLHPDGCSELVAGKGNAGFAGDGGPATEATLHPPLMLA